MSKMEQVKNILEQPISRIAMDVDDSGKKLYFMDKKDRYLLSQQIDALYQPEKKEVIKCQEECVLFYECDKDKNPSECKYLQPASTDMLLTDEDNLINTFASSYSHSIAVSTLKEFNAWMKQHTQKSEDAIRAEYEQRIKEISQATDMTSETIRADQQAKDYKEIIPILEDLIDSGDCDIDHHGYCQAHGWLESGL